MSKIVIEAIMSATPVSQLQQKLNERAAKKLEDDITAAVTPLSNLLNQCPECRPVIRVQTEDNHPARVAAFMALSELRCMLNSSLMPRYIARETSEFLSQVDRVADLAQERCA